ncbi:2-dehydropantoate 2-reductase [Pseudoxanthomonas sp.]|uniref:2-dehydropantoate 2-reductase n=1 Tax=Pseudoxanthomonas sp. TaxID=1871049 RepID=UPI00261B3B06|nr:2-dehydropantoate 2-reductase [Pseudoxanthomonas sp.]WDS35054.1 MAG: 2-dehydropantoate 2-reductase [Pseudoxanthomonas sp.]
MKTRAGPRVAIIGPGAIGLSIAAILAKAGCSVEVCGGSHRFEHCTVVDARGSWSFPVAHHDNPSALEGINIAVLATKAQHTDAAQHWLRALPDGTSVLIAQNGIELEERAVKHVGQSALIPSVMYLNAERTSPGCVTIRQVGDADVCLPDVQGGRIFIDLLKAGGLRVATSADLRTTAWAKLLTNITANPLTALTGRRVDVIREAGITSLARTLMNEAAAVARADGAALTDRHVEDALQWLLNAPPDATTSMREDRLAGRPMEYDALTGAVLRAADRHGMDVPANRLIHSLLVAVQP